VNHPSWYVLIHEIPARPLYLRVKIRKRLESLGAIPLKDAVYVAPVRDGILGRLEEVARDARAAGAQAHVFAADFVEAGARAALMGSFRRRRDEDYMALSRSVRAVAARARRGGGTAPSRGMLLAGLARAKRRLAAIEAIDFFEAAARAKAVASVAALEELLEPPPRPPRSKAIGGDLIDRTWVTRRGIQVDRIASAWLVRRFVDPKARFRFIDPGNPDPRRGEITYDMVGADFTHEGDRCSFETLIFRLRIRDTALARVAEIVHEIDIKDGKYARPETKGVQQMLSGMLAANPDDEARLDRGFAMFDDLYQSFRHALSPRARPSPGQIHSSKGDRK
jgi:hypothetical protein